MQPSPRSRRLLCDAPARRLNVQMGYMLRYNPAFELCRKLIREGALGEYNAGRQTLTFPKGRGRYGGDFEDLAKVSRGEKALEFSPAHDCAVHETILRASGLPVESMCDVGRVLGIQMPNC